MAVVGGSVLLCAVGWGQLAALLSLACCASLYPLASGWLVRTVLGATTLCAFWVSAATACDALGVPLPPSWLAGAGLLVMAPLARRWGRPGWGTRVGDRPIMLAVALTVVATAPKLFGSTEARINRLVFGYDNAAHVRYSIAMGEAHGYTFRFESIPGLYGPTSYRPAGSFLAEYLPWIVRGGLAAPTTAQSIAGAEAIYSLQMVACVAAGLLLLRELAWTARRLSRAAMLVSGTAVFLMLFVGIVPVVANRGFQAQSLANAALVAGLLCLAQVRRGLGVSGAVVTAAGALAVALNAWPLAAGPLAVALAWVALRHLRRISWWAWGLTALLAAVAAYPVYGPRQFYSNADWLSSQSTAVMPVPITSWLGLATLAAIALSVHYLRAPRDPVASVLTAAMVGALAMPLAVLGVQLVTGAGVGGYYLIKSVYALVLIAIICVGDLVVDLLTEWSGGLPRVVCLAAVALVATLAWLPFGVSAVVTSWPQPDRNVLETEPIAAALARYPDGAPPTVDMVVLGTCSKPASDYTTRWLGTILHSWSPARDVLVERLGVEGETLAGLRDYLAQQPQRSVEVFAREGCPLATQIQDAHLRGVSVIHLMPPA
ncbi:hypothetical protein [Nostocoides sp. HKS02]|uniref:hypothetical protein n=1 Tax=Nostocoides sp. HKS02 TaxID=1813880 RepID=UPI0012B46219|nr:hypothetical protein [Tetrasphaera sp. HKS02]QGN56715.1 hypothetical protein GKE56_01020 [Tetrasphaera sp. HKS02]